MKIEYLTHMGDDLMVVNAARVSFDKQSEWEHDEYCLAEGCDSCDLGLGQVMKASDSKLIHYLAKHNHWTPFAHPQLQVRVTVPIFIANQLKRHNVGLVVNEVSRRYVDDAPHFYAPAIWRGRPEGSIKQGSSETEITGKVGLAYSEDLYEPIGLTYMLYNGLCREFYTDLLKLGVCPEQARMVLPQSMYTSWVWTGSLMAFIRIVKLRKDPHAQKEIQIVAEQIEGILKQHWPVSCEAWGL